MPGIPRYLPLLAVICFDIFKTIAVFTTGLSARRLRLGHFVVNLASMDANIAKDLLVERFLLAQLRSGRDFSALGVSAQYG